MGEQGIEWWDTVLGGRVKAYDIHDGKKTHKDNSQQGHPPHQHTQKLHPILRQGIVDRLLHKPARLHFRHPAAVIIHRYQDIIVCSSQWKLSSKSEWSQNMGETVPVLVYCHCFCWMSHAQQEGCVAWALWWHFWHFVKSGCFLLEESGAWEGDRFVGDTLHRRK